LGSPFCPAFLSAGGKAGIERVVDHIEHAVAVAGAGAVGLGSDFDGFDGTVPGLEDVTGLSALADALRARGFTPDEVAMIMGENWARLLERALPE